MSLTQITIFFETGAFDRRRTQAPSDPVQLLQPRQQPAVTLHQSSNFTKAALLLPCWRALTRPPTVPLFPLSISQPDLKAEQGSQFFHSKKYYKICSHLQKPRLLSLCSFPAGGSDIVYSYRVYWVVFCSKRCTKGITYSTVGLFTYAHMLTYCIWEDLNEICASSCFNTDQRRQSTKIPLEIIPNTVKNHLHLEGSVRHPLSTQLQGYEWRLHTCYDP